RMAQTALPPKNLHVLMSACAPKRREGGAAAIAYNLGRELQALGHQISYVFLEDLFESTTVPTRFQDLQFSRKLARYIAANRGKFSIVHLHAPAGMVYGLRRRYLGGASYPPYIMLLHGLEERRGHVMSREHKKGRAWHFSWKNRLWHRLYHQPRFRWSIRTADGAHTYSRDTWNLMQLKYNLDAERVAYIPNGAEARFFVPRQYPDRDGLRLLYAGTWLDQRGIFYLREALANLIKRIPRVNMTFAGCGVSAEEIHSFFGAELAKCIEVRPAVPAEAMPGLYLEHDVFLFPSLVEGLPTVLLEAMATGMPVITAETCGMPDVVENEYNGLLIPPADSAAIESAVMHLAGCRELRERLGTTARETMKRYTWQRAGRQLEAFMRRILERERAS
ncbi:MAG: glycosyltransferase family 4 protein, partial [Candidatus Acidiferrum sp.]